MARISDVTTSDLERDASPDPITLPSSPLAPHSAQSRRTRNSIKPSPRKTPRRSATPSKSMVIDTPNAGEASPWRIRVTVEAEPREGSPTKSFSKTTSVPLQGSATKGKRSSSPVKRALAKKADAGEIKRPARKRKATPIREKRAAPYQPQSPQQVQLQSEHKLLQQDDQTRDEPDADVNMDMNMDHAHEADDEVPTPSLLAARRASGKLSRLSSVHEFAQSKRLSVAREELDLALQKAVGHSSPRFTASPRYSVPGDKTVSLNEDFSIISVDSLKSAKEASFSRSKGEGDASAATVSYMASSPPKSHYPDISTKATKARSGLANEYDPMSWRPTGPGKRISPPQDHVRPNSRRQNVEQQWQRERESVSRQIDDADPEKVVVVQEGEEADDDDADDQFEEDEAGAQDEDLWQGEASRSLEEERRSSYHQLPNHGNSQREERFEDLFAGQPLKPPRSKIPRTWRRSSGMDFSYVDSPAHDLAQHVEQPDEEEEVEEEAEEEERRHSTDGSGVLTPPSTDEDEEMEDDQAQEEDPESEFQPDAEATQYHIQDDGMEDDFGPPDDGARTPDSEAESHDENDTGNFFWNNLPQVFKTSSKKTSAQRRRRPEKQQTMDLTELLGLNGEKSPAKAVPVNSKAGSPLEQERYGPIPMRPLDANIKMAPADHGRTKALDSPLRKSLLKSSKLQDAGTANIDTSQQEDSMPDSGIDVTNAPKRRWGRKRPNDEGTHLLRKPPRRSQAHEPVESTQAPNAGEDEEMEGDGQQSKGHIRLDQEDELQEEFEEEGEDLEPSQSYEERLNLDSPQKIKVNFNDSSSLFPRRDQSSVLDFKSSLSMANAKKRFPPLFGSRATFDEQTIEEESSQGSNFDPSGEITLVAKQPQQANQPGFLSRLSSTFWSAVIRPTGPSEIMPEQQPQVTELVPMDLLRQIRQRYGVVSEDFPWDMSHMRTLHRMLNSLTSRRSDSIIPTSGPLPFQLAKRVDTWQTSITGFRFQFARKYAYVVYTFMQIMVPEETITAMNKGEIEFIGDETAWNIRGFYRNDTRHGTDPVWSVERGNTEDVCNFVDAQQGKIGVDFVIRALGDVLLANKIYEEREGMSIAEMQRLGRI